MSLNVLAVEDFRDISLEREERLDISYIRPEEHSDDAASNAIPVDRWLNIDQESERRWLEKEWW